MTNPSQNFERGSRERKSKEIQVLTGGGVVGVGAQRTLTVSRADGTIHFYIEVPDGTDTLKFSSGNAPGAANHFYIDDDGIYTFETQDSASNTGAELILRGLETTPGDGDTVGVIKFQGNESDGGVLSYAQIYGTSEDVTTGTTDGGISILVESAGAGNMPLRMVGNQVVVASGTTLTTTPDFDLHSKGDIGFDGDLYSAKNSTSYDVYGYHPLTTALTSTSWDGDAYSTTAKTLIDLSSVFGAPAGIKAVDITCQIRDSASQSNSAWIILGPTSTAGTGRIIRVGGKGNDKWASESLVVPCDANGDIYYQIQATGSLTLDVNMQIWGYYI